MSRKQKPPPKKPSKAYLVSFGDTMTALLAFFIVLNSFAKDQTGANMHTGTGSFVNSGKAGGLSGSKLGNLSGALMSKTAPTPIYAVPGKETTDKKSRYGEDEEGDSNPIIDRQADNFQRFLSEMQYQFEVQESPPTESQIVFDSFENLNRNTDKLLASNAIQIASDAINQLTNEEFQLEIIVWSTMPSALALQNAMEKSLLIEKQLDESFSFRGTQRQRLSVSAKPWLFFDAKRPRISFVLSRMDSQ